MEMKCPIDGSDLQMSERQGIEIDYCQKCRGVWLDRGELDKIIERSGTQSSREDARERDEYEDRQYRTQDDRGGRHPRKKREGFLSDLFEFGD